MPTLNEEAADLLRVLYRLHEYEPGFQLSNASYSDKADAALALVKSSRALKRMAVARCNGIPRYDAKARMVLASWTDDDETRAERADKRAETRIRDAMVTIYGSDWADRIDLECQGDPRGAMVKLWASGFRGKGWPRVAL